MLQRFKDSVHGRQMDVGVQEKIMHIALPFGEGSVLMATDALECMGQNLLAGNNFLISVAADSEKEAIQLFEGLSVGGQVTMPLEKTFWNAPFGIFTDKFNIQWMVNYDYE